MTHAICFSCGEDKSGSFVECPACKSFPQSDDDMVLSMALNDNYLNLPTLQKISADIKIGEKVGLDPASLKSLLPEVIKFREGPMWQSILKVQKDKSFYRDATHIAMKNINSQGELFARSVGIGYKVMEEVFLSKFINLQDYIGAGPETQKKYVELLIKTTKELHQEGKREYATATSILANLIMILVKFDKSFQIEIKQLIENTIHIKIEI